MEDAENSDSNHNVDDVNMSENEDDGGGNREDEAQEVNNNPAGEAIKPKRIIKNPQPKLDAVRLMGPRGIGILPSTFKDTTFKGKGYEREDLNLLMKKLEHWAHRLFPKLTFDDTLKQIEKLGTKKPVQNLVRRIRLDMYQSDEMVEGTGNTGTENSNTVEEVDVFDEILGTGPYAANKSIPSMGNATMSHFTDLLLPATPPISSSPASQKQMILTEEQKERIERNKRLAAERRKTKMLEQKNLAEAAMESCGDSSQNISSQITNAEELFKTAMEADSSITASMESFSPSHITKVTNNRVDHDIVTIPSKLNETVPPNKSINLDNSKSNDRLDADLVSCVNPKSSEICTEDDILALMDDDL